MRHSRKQSSFSVIALGALALFLFVHLVSAAPAAAASPDRTDPLPTRAKGIDVTERLGTSLPTDLGFVDQEGKPVTLADFFDGKKPVIVTMNYSNCPMLCSLQLNGLTKTLAAMPLGLGTDYRVVTISFDPNDTSVRLGQMRTRLLRNYKTRALPAGAWTFLHGSLANIRAVAESLGISYTYNEERKEFLHPAVVAVLSPKAVISRYLYGLELQPQTTRLSLVEASEGKTGSSLDRLILFCFHYDSSEGKYAPVAVNIMRASGVVAVLALGLLLASFWYIELRKRKRVVEVHT